jgi:hypothetical protein
VIAARGAVSGSMSVLRRMLEHVPPREWPSCACRRDIGTHYSALEELNDRSRPAGLRQESKKCLEHARAAEPPEPLPDAVPIAPPLIRIASAIGSQLYSARSLLPRMLALHPASVSQSLESPHLLGVRLRGRGRLLLIERMIALPHPNCQRGLPRYMSVSLLSICIGTGET